MISQITLLSRIGFVEHLYGAPAGNEGGRSPDTGLGRKVLSLHGDPAGNEGGRAVKTLPYNRLGRIGFRMRQRE